MDEQTVGVDRQRPTRSRASRPGGYPLPEGVFIGGLASGFSDWDSPVRARALSPSRADVASVTWQGADVILSWDPGRDRSMWEWEWISSWVCETTPRSWFRELHQQGRHTVDVALVPEPDNPYNQNAVLVVGVADNGDRPWLGYVPDHYLEEVGWGTLPALAEVARSRGGELRCPAVLDDEVVHFALPLDLRAIAEPFLAGEGAARDLDEDSQEVAHTAAVLEAIATPQRRVGRLGAMSLSVEVDDVDGERVIRVSSEDGVTVATVDGDRNLTLVDEEDRGEVVRFLLAQRVPVAPMVALPRGDGPRVPVRQNLRLARSLGGGLVIEVMARLPGRRRFGDAIAFYNPETTSLWIQHPVLRDAAVEFADRAGLVVEDVHVSETSWHRSDSVSWPANVDDAEWEDHLQPQFADIPAADLLFRHQETVPAGLLDDVVTWVLPPGETLSGQEAEHLLAVEGLAPERAQLFPGHTLTGELAACRLCAAGAATLVTPWCTQPVAYCQRCLAAAAAGLRTSRSVTSAAVAELAAVEFQGVAMVPSQLETLQGNDRQPWEPELVDRLLLLRFAIGRRHPWTLVIVNASLAPDGVRRSRGMVVLASDGHLCLSLMEKVVCEFLHERGVEHEKEPRYPADDVWNPDGRWRADWRLGDGTLVELWGMPGVPAYAARMEQKRTLARHHGLRLVELTAADLSRLEEVFGEWLP